MWGTNQRRLGDLLSGRLLRVLQSSPPTVKAFYAAVRARAIDSCHRVRSASGVSALADSQSGSAALSIEARRSRRGSSWSQRPNRSSSTEARCFISPVRVMLLAVLTGGRRGESWAAGRLALFHANVARW